MTIRRGLAIVCAGLMLLAGACAGEDGDLLTQGLQQHADGKLDEAARTYRSVLEEDPSNKFAHYNLGLIEQTEGRNDTAARWYRRALLSDPKFTAPMFNLAVIQTADGPREAVGLYEMIIEIEPENAAAHLNLGFLLKKLGEEARGDAELSKAVKLDPSLESRLSPRPSQGPATPAP